jgi:hypothetical protein
MKKHYLLLLVIALISIKIYSQESRIKYSFQGGLNYSSFRGYDSFVDDKPGIAYLFGASFEYKIKDKLSLKIDVNYERKVQKSDNTLELNPGDAFNSIIGGIYNYSITNYSNYIVLPILVKYNFSNDNSFYLNGGPFLGFLINSRINSDLVIKGIDTNPRTTTTKNYKSLDYGLSLGVGKQFKINGENKIYVELRDNLGLTNTSEVEVYNNGKIMTNSINLIVGYTIN